MYVLLFLSLSLPSLLPLLLLSINDNVTHPSTQQYSNHHQYQSYLNLPMYLSPQLIHYCAQYPATPLPSPPLLLPLPQIIRFPVSPVLIAPP
ncbi:hypothetical protein F4775DRAFT_534011 [Biscogniauxia sp. FL1348]|nr:hypothetical protein F4775DRAFT_534011 [Biscogniauxia sp. FL1348]